LEGQALLEKDTAKKEAKAVAKASRKTKKKEVFFPLPVSLYLLNTRSLLRFTIKRIQRNKNKYVTSIPDLRRSVSKHDQSLISYGRLTGLIQRWI